jgi:pilus assembly protein CpaD
MNHLRNRHVRGIPIALALAAALTACATPHEDGFASEGSAPAPHQPVVSFQTRTLVIHFRDGLETPDPEQIAPLNVLLGTGELGRGDHVLIQRPAGALDRARAELLSAALEREGLSPAVAIDPAVGAMEMRLIVEHATASAPGCPDWTKSPDRNFANTVHSNFGCATAVNLAAMIADPHDLLNGRALGPEVGDPAAAPMHRYNTGKLPTLSTSANISQLGAAGSAGTMSGAPQ